MDICLHREKNYKTRWSWWILLSILQFFILPSCLLLSFTLSDSFKYCCHALTQSNFRRYLALFSLLPFSISSLHCSMVKIILNKCIMPISNQSFCFLSVYSSFFYLDLFCSNCHKMPRTRKIPIFSRPHRVHILLIEW